MEDRHSTFSTLQHLLQLSYSENPEDQQKAAVDLSKLVNGTVFPAVSFGPLAHALCKLIPSNNRTVSSYSARALKILLLDDALRPQTIVAGVPAVVCSAIKQWEDEILCLRELLGALQTLSWDRQCVRGVLQTDIICSLIDYIKASDQEVSVLAVATLANICSYSDTLLLGDAVAIETLGKAVPSLVEALKNAHQKPTRLYAAAAVANASYHPRLAALLLDAGALQLCRELERQSLMNLHVLGSKLGECAQTAVYRLSDKKEGDPKVGGAKYTFKWGTKPVMELSLVPYAKHSTLILVCFALWVGVVLFTFMPLLFA
ncbi:hypothetical protein B484DRAFT_459536 [Ochromonadaceae sp. CCMP2298]|nr:hypothetical protein B484DRAFT_459536 [Ochromonadaceae sp. CCMP2298]|mmetsp:Transcript_22585/g.50220  ORF Transcript_22585/g.50220 Transcript_22585/m.50220 type:complete len:317 (+) Transcript_22585:95-1045(+)|eukprot:CAMPEP_0173238900 /NCGR_PEP_ID=MMETSP1142-20121109/12899_1 /TAXON_ID=483371 /ORGANISM="non described non described, Strain CCMP2298" /LENGTH=316 /DNA_ID=CAMNT_0014169825 /DNA_START=24 /DNA_END=974 /DNA_ORIENTATION=-